MTKDDAKGVKAAFLGYIINLDLNEITALKPPLRNYKASKKYLQILSSVAEIGLVEPLVVFPDPKRKSHYLLLDGHTRLLALQALGETHGKCLVGTDDDTYTYNKKINRLASIQSIKMIIRAVNSKVPAEIIAKALNLSTQTILSKFSLLEGICADAVKILDDQEVPMGVFPILKKMKPLRQIEVAQLMKRQHNFSVKFAKALLINSSASDIVQTRKTKRITQASSESIAQLERELSTVRLRQNTTQDTLSQDILKLSVIKNYISKLLNNVEVVKWLAKNENNYLIEYQKLTEMLKLPE